MEKHEAINKLEEMADSREEGYLVARYYLSNLAELTGKEYESCVSQMLEWINAKSNPGL